MNPLWLLVWAALGYWGLHVGREVMVGTRDPRHGRTAKQEVAEGFVEEFGGVAFVLMALLTPVLWAICYVVAVLLVISVGVLIVGILGLLAGIGAAVLSRIPVKKAKPR